MIMVQEGTMSDHKLCIQMLEHLSGGWDKDSILSLSIINEKSDR